MNVYFVDDESPMPDPVLSRDGNIATLFLRRELMPLWIDVLRNEKPIFGVIDTAQPSASHIATKSELIGEEETSMSGMRFRKPDFNARREVELRCDAIAVLTLLQLDLDPALVVLGGSEADALQRTDRNKD